MQGCALSERNAMRRWGPKVGRSYIQRVGLLRQASDLQEFSGSRAYHLHALTGDRQGRWAINLTERWRLEFTITDGRVTIEEVNNHYDD